MEFSKRPLETVELVQRLISRGMVIEDIPNAEHILNHINYYRLSAYWRIFENNPVIEGHIFRPGTTLDRVERMYRFDSEIRHLLMKEIEKVEASLRRGWAGHLSLKYGAFAHQNRGLFTNQGMWAKSLEKLKEDYGRSEEQFAKHYLANYPNLELPPIWVCTELLTLGSLSKLIVNLAEPKDRQAISRSYYLDEVVFMSFLHHLVILRNMVAHHSRIWNRRFVFRFKLPKNPILGLCDSFNLDKEKVNSLYNTLVMITYLSMKIDLKSTTSRQIIELLGRYPEIDPRSMGFPPRWQEMRIWL
jgi:abortive infection bacteriophage resistance protein